MIKVDFPALDVPLSKIICPSAIALLFFEPPNAALHLPPDDKFQSKTISPYNTTSMASDVYWRNQSRWTVYLNCKATIIKGSF
jgi:hypothetical protein